MLVAIEGIDGSGKGTVTKCLERLINDSSDFSACSMSFPGYSKTSYGKLIGRYLNGELGDVAAHPLIHGTLFALDRFESKSDIEELNRKFDFVIFDRYVPSNFCYSTVLAPEAEREDVLKHFVNLEYNVLEMPPPDVVFFLNLPIDLALANIAKKAKREYTERSADIFEADKTYLKKVKDFYEYELEKVSEKSIVEKVNCFKHDELISIQAISSYIFRRLKSHVK